MIKLIDETGQLTEAGVALHDEVLAANPDPEQLIAILVEADWMASSDDAYGTDQVVLPAYLWRNSDDGSINLWNGFVQPLFRREIAERLVAAQQQLVAEDTDGIYAPMRFDGETLVTTVEPVYAAEVDEPETRSDGIEVGPDRARLYGVGDGWTWIEVGGTLERGDAFHSWLAAQKRSGAKLGSPVGNPALLERFRAESTTRS